MLIYVSPLNDVFLRLEEVSLILVPIRPLEIILLIPLLFNFLGIVAVLLYFCKIHLLTAKYLA